MLLPTHLGLCAKPHSLSPTSPAIVDGLSRKLEARRGYRGQDWLAAARGQLRGCRKSSPGLLPPEVWPILPRTLLPHSLGLGSGRKGSLLLGHRGSPGLTAALRESRGRKQGARQTPPKKAGERTGAGEAGRGPSRPWEALCRLPSPYWLHRSDQELWKGGRGGSG